MNNIRKAVELADGWTYLDGAQKVLSWDGLIVPAVPALDALAAQLVRQVDALQRYGVMVDVSNTEVWDPELPPQNETLIKVPADGEERLNNGRTMNTINAIVESGVLE